MDKEIILQIWLGLPLIDRIKLWSLGQIMGLEGKGIEELFPEKFMIERWLASERS